MRRTLYLATVLIALLLVAVPVQAGEESGEKTLSWLDHLAVEINNTDGDQLRISYDVEVTEGVNVNIYFMDEEGYDDFVSFQNFSYYELYSVKDTDDAEKEWTWTKEGTFYVVIENAGWQSFDITTFDYEVEWDVSGSVWWGLPILWCLILLVVFAVIGIAAIWLVMAAMKARKEGTAEGTRGEGGTGSPPPGEGGTGSPPPGKTETFPGAQVYETSPPPAEGETWEGAHTLEQVPLEEGETSPMTTTVPMEDTTGRLDGATELGPQPEPPDSETHGETVMSHGEGATELSPQPEPPDSETGAPAGSGGSGSEGPMEEPAPGTTTYPSELEPGPAPMAVDAPPPSTAETSEPIMKITTDPDKALDLKKPGKEPPAD